MNCACFLAVALALARFSPSKAILAAGEGIKPREKNDFLSATRLFVYLKDWLHLRYEAGGLDIDVTLSF